MMIGGRSPRSKTARVGELLGLNVYVHIILDTDFRFSGTLRFNLDPVGEASDLNLWQSLERSHLEDHVPGPKRAPNFWTSIPHLPRNEDSPKSPNN